jgi:NADPH-dependent F420 reductase
VIGIVGGSGDFGQGIATRLRAHGHDVLIGSRTPRDDFVSNPEACDRSDVVFLSVPPAHVEAMAQELGQHLRGKIAVSVATAVVFRDGRPTAEPGTVSIAELLAAGAPEARVVSGFHTVSAKGLADAAHELDDDVLLCGDDDEAKESVAALARQIVSGRVIDAGPLSVSRWLETITAVLLNVNRRYKAHTGIKITGLP